MTMHDIRFERCQIQVVLPRHDDSVARRRHVYNIEFSDINFTSQYQATPWWGRGEAISLTAIPRAQAGKVGRIHDVRLRNVDGPRGKQRADRRRS